MQTLFIFTNNSRAVMIDIIVKVFERSHPCQTKFRWTEHAQMCGQASKMAQKCLQTCLNPLKTKGHHSASVHIEQMGFAAQACRWQSLQMQAWGNKSGNKPSTEQLSSCFTEHCKQQHQSPWNWQLDLVQPFLLWSPFKIDLGNINFSHLWEHKGRTDAETKCRSDRKYKDDNLHLGIAGQVKQAGALILNAGHAVDMAADSGWWSVMPTEYIELPGLCSRTGVPGKSCCR